VALCRPSARRGDEKRDDAADNGVQCDGGRNGMSLRSTPEQRDLWIWRPNDGERFARRRAARRARGLVYRTTTAVFTVTPVLSRSLDAETGLPCASSGPGQTCAGL
jgi:hypothetical protein